MPKTYTNADLRGDSRSPGAKRPDDVVGPWTRSPESQAALDGIVNAGMPKGDPVGDAQKFLDRTQYSELGKNLTLPDAQFGAPGAAHPEHSYGEAIGDTAEAMALPASFASGPAGMGANAYYAYEGLKNFAENPSLLNGGIAALGAIPAYGHFKELKNALGTGAEAASHVVQDFGQGVGDVASGGSAGSSNPIFGNAERSRIARAGNERPWQPSAPPKPPAAPVSSHVPNTYGDVIRPGDPDWVPPSQPLKYPVTGKFAKPSLAAKNAERDAVAGVPYAVPTAVKTSKAAMSGVRAATAPALNPETASRMTLEEEQKLRQMMPGLRAKVDTLKPSVGGVDTPGNLSTGSVFRGSPEPMPSHSVSRESPLSAIMRGDYSQPFGSNAAETVGTPRFEAGSGGIKDTAAARFSKPGSSGPAMASHRTTFSPGQEQGMAALADLLDRIHGNGGEAPSVGNGLAKAEPSGPTNILRSSPAQELNYSTPDVAEASKRRVMFGGVRPVDKATGVVIPPNKRGPISMKRITDFAKNGKKGK